MSRIGKTAHRRARPASTSTIDGRDVTVKGPKGTLSPHRRRADHGRESDDDGAPRSRARTTSAQRGSLHGLTRTLVSNMVVGVTEGYEKKLEIVGVGYRVAVQGPDQLEFALGYSHPITFDAPEGITFTVEARPGSRSSGHRQAAGRRGRREHPQAAQARAVQGQGRALRRRAHPPQGRKGW